MAERMKYCICAHAKAGGMPKWGVNDWPVKPACPNPAKTKSNTILRMQICESCQDFKMRMKKETT